MADFDRVPVVEVHRDNLADLWPSMLDNIRAATFVAIDTELSGLGNRKLLGAKDLDDRYHHMCAVARSRSMVSLGLSCYHLSSSSRVSGSAENTFPRPTAAASQLHWRVHTYNIVTLCEDEYVVEPTSLRFLVEHGFDFNKQYAQGVPYHRGNDKESDDPTSPSLRLLFTELLLSRCAVVLHNAVIDLVFLYHSLYAALPTSQQAFLADLAEMFVGGVYDTKYLVDYKARMGASYLQYVFRKVQRDNLSGHRSSSAHITCTFPATCAAVTPAVVYQACGLPDTEPDTQPTGQLHMDNLCLQYAYHGWCPNGNDCPKSHDIDLILKTQEHGQSHKRSKKRRRDKKAATSGEVTGSTAGETDNSEVKTAETKTVTHNGDHSGIDGAATTSKDSDITQDGSSENRLISTSGSHMAGFDAFMTGFIFGYFVSRYGERSTEENSESDSNSAELFMDEYKHKVYLVGKDIPLQIIKSSFAKNSKDHRAKIKKIGLAT